MGVGDTTWYVGCAFCTLLGIFNLATAVMNFFWTCFGVSLFGWEMDVVYGKMFFTYPTVPFSKIEGLFALFLSIGGFMSWAEDPSTQLIAMLLMVVGSGYWIVCTMYAILVKDTGLAVGSIIIVGLSLGFGYSRVEGYVADEVDVASFHIVSGIVLVLSVIISIAGALTYDEEKKELVAKLLKIKKYCSETENVQWPVENAHDVNGEPDGFKDWDKS